MKIKLKNKNLKMLTWKWSQVKKNPTKEMKRSIKHRAKDQRHIGCDGNESSNRRIT